MHSYSTALSHLVLAGTGIYCLNRTYYAGEGIRVGLPVVTFTVIVTHSVIGVWRWGNPSHGDKVERPYKFTQVLQTLFALPCIAGQICLNSGYNKELAYLHPGLSLVPFAAYLADKMRDDLVDYILAANLISCSILSFYQENFYGIAAAVSFAINRYWIADRTSVFDVPAQDFFNYAFCFFTYFAYRAVGGRITSL